MGCLRGSKFTCIFIYCPPCVKRVFLSFATCSTGERIGKRVDQSSRRCSDSPPATSNSTKIAKPPSRSRIGQTLTIVTPNIPCELDGKLAPASPFARGANLLRSIQCTLVTPNIPCELEDAPEHFDGKRGEFREEHRHEALAMRLLVSFVSSRRADFLYIHVCRQRDARANFLYRRAGAKERSAITLFAIRNRYFQGSV